jgi:hypothetical protein
MQLDGVDDFLANGRYIRKTDATLGQIAENRGIEASWLQSLAENARVNGGEGRNDPYISDEVTLFSNGPSITLQGDAWRLFNEWKDGEFIRGHWKTKELGEQGMWRDALKAYGIKIGKNSRMSNRLGKGPGALWVTFPPSGEIEAILREKSMWIELDQV